MKKYLHLVVAALSLGSFVDAVAGAMGPSVDTSSYFMATLGGFGVYQGESQFVPIETLVGNTYFINDHNDVGFIAGLGYFKSLLPITSYPADFGISAYYLSSTSVSGTVLQENLFENLSYTYNVTHVPLYAMVTTQLLKTASLPVSLNVGIGPNFQIINKYKETPLDDITLPDNAFKGGTKAVFSATAGLSVSLGSVFKQNVGCGYQFMFLGQSELETNNSQIMSNLKTGPAFANVGFCAVKF